MSAESTLDHCETRRRGIELRGVRTHNLRAVDLDLPLGQVILLAGVSGSGKSSLAVDTLFAEGQRRFLTASGLSVGQRLPRPPADSLAGIPPAVLLDGDRPDFFGRTVGVVTGIAEPILRGVQRAGWATCAACGEHLRAGVLQESVDEFVALPDGTRRLIAFPVPADLLAREVVEHVRESGFRRLTDGKTVWSVDDMPPDGLGHALWGVVDRLTAGKSTPARLREALELARREGDGRWALVDTEAVASPWSHGADEPVCPHCGVTAPEMRAFAESGTDSLPVCRTCAGAAAAMKDCQQCAGTGWNVVAKRWHYGTRTLAEWWKLAADDWCGPAAPEFASEEEARIRAQCQVLCDAGLGRVSLSRSADDLPAAARRAVGLATIALKELTAALVILDEPFRGWHPSELPAGRELIQRLRDQENSVVLIEHRLETAAFADWVVELGPGAGAAGGNITFAGPPAEFSAQTEVTEDVEPVAASRSAEKTRAKRSVKVERKFTWLDEQQAPREAVLAGQAWNVIVGRWTARTDRLLSIDLPRQLSADGEYEVETIEDQPLTASARATLVSWLGVLTDIRKLFAESADARRLGWSARKFSYAALDGGGCRECRGRGRLVVPSALMVTLERPCPVCGGTRYRSEVLAVKHRGASIADVLRQTVDEASEYFRSLPSVQQQFQTLRRLGLGYLVLGQAVHRLSAGESRRLRLGARLSRSTERPTWLLIDEPAGGLHPADLPTLAKTLGELVDVGHTLVTTDAAGHLAKWADRVIVLDDPT
jgi:excinuclease ABC subunit A